MSVCKFCNEDMLVADGCKHEKIVCGGKEYEPIKVGDPGDFFEGEANARCGDCNAKHGHYHHLGCDCERCPVCGGQIISCDCVFSE